jgi:molybdopterin synthase sulfur carrier subunit
MEIHVKGYLTFRPLVGKRKMLVDREMLLLSEFINCLVDEIGEEFASAVFEPGSVILRPHIAILVNGMHYTHLPHHLDTPLNNGDEVSIFPPLAGGGRINPYSAEL